MIPDRHCLFISGTCFCLALFAGCFLLGCDSPAPAVSVSGDPELAPLLEGEIYRLQDAGLPFSGAYRIEYAQTASDSRIGETSGRSVSIAPWARSFDTEQKRRAVGHEAVHAAGVLGHPEFAHGVRIPDLVPDWIQAKGCPCIISE